MYGRRFEKELKLIDASVASESGDKVLRAYMKPWVESIVHECAVEYGIVHIASELLINAGWTHFSLAVKRYRQRAALMLEGKNEVFYFSSYLKWFIKQGVLEFLQGLKDSDQLPGHSKK